MKLKILALIAAAAMSWCGATHAAEVSFSEYRPAPPSNTVSFGVPLFDRTLGQLTSVWLMLDVTANSSVPVSRRTLLSLVDPTFEVTGVTDSDGWDATFMIPPGTGPGRLPSQLFIHMSKLVDTTQSLALFLGGAPSSATGLFRLFNVSDTPDPRISLADFDFTVVYTYLDVTPDVSAVPVPASAWLMGSGMVAMGLFLRRRRSQSTAAF
jgi:hypothetical protein